MRICRQAVILLGAVPAVVAGQIRMSVPQDTFFLGHTTAIANSGGLRDLRSANMPTGDIEFRFWAGYGLNGTFGLILRRSNDTWTVEEVEKQSCGIAVYESRQNPLTAAQIAEYEKQALTPCSRRPRGGGNRVLTAFRLQRGRVDTLPNGSGLWTEMLDSGAAALPPAVPRKGMMLDGHGFVIEFRDGQQYRASDIDCMVPEAESGNHVQRIGRLLYRLRPLWWLRCDTQPPR